MPGYSKNAAGNPRGFIKVRQKSDVLSESREDAGFFAVTGGSAAQSSIIDDFATLPLYITYCSIYYLGFTGNGKPRSLFP